MIVMNDLFAKYFLENLRDCKHSKKIAKKFISLYAKKNFEEFLGTMLEGYPHLCGYDEAQAYVRQGEVIEFGKVLCPKIPYILGGEDSGLTRLYFGEFSTLYADIYTQTKDLPDGAQIEIEIVR